MTASRYKYPKIMSITYIINIPKIESRWMITHIGSNISCPIHLTIGKTSGKTDTKSPLISSSGTTNRLATTTNNLYKNPGIFLFRTFFVHENQQEKKITGSELSKTEKK